MSLRRAELIAVGSELLEPWRTDTNGSYLSRVLGERGIAVRFRTVVGDVMQDVQAAFRVALERSDLIIATGGLGPTIDDRTREAVAGLLGLSLDEDPGLLRRIEERFRRHSLSMPPQNRRQAMVPRGAEVLPNGLGTAPGLLLRSGAATVALLPGVPDEMRQITEESVLPRLGPVAERFAYRVIKIAGLTESEVDRRLSEVARRAAPADWTILAAPGQVEIHLRERVPDGRPAAALDRIDREIAGELESHVFARDEDTMEDVVGRLLAGRGESLSSAESLTGGEIAQRITRVPGASRYFRGGVVAYTEEAKRTVLGVRADTLKAEGSVGPETAGEMARGARRLFGSTWALSATGYAGPQGGGPGQPPGTVFLGLSDPRGEATRALSLPGTRETVRSRTARTALDLLRRAILETAA
ncbi:MAG TPA: competence/damage-inducible protein A [Candidatus Dormibacteraeota bacterium]|nr:competence/damage-inducible protein A [Candidatus Dormibacteraeota bacterium]